MATANSEALLARLIGFDTTSTTSNLELIDFVRNLLDDHGVTSQLVHNDDRSRANLYATIGPDDVSGVMLSGHTDVVPTTGQDWNSDPYQMRTGDELLTGRGGLRHERIYRQRVGHPAAYHCRSTANADSPGLLLRRRNWLCRRPTPGRSHGRI